MDILKDLRDGKPCRWTGVCGEMSAVGGCTCGEAADEIERLQSALLQQSTDNIDLRHDLARANKKIERLREALKKIVELDWQFKTSYSLQRTEGPCAAIARAALKEDE